MNRTAKKIIIGESKDTYRELLKAYLTEQGYTIADDTSDGLDLIIKSFQMNPDIILVDLELPVIDGLKAAKVIKELNNSIKIIAMTVYDEQCFYKSICGYIDWFIVKPLVLENINRAISKIYCEEDDFFLDGGADGAGTYDQYATYLEKTKNIYLTRQEKQILKHVLIGMDNRSIANKFSISVSTVKFHVRNILHKYKARDRGELIKRFGLLSAHTGL